MNGVGFAADFGIDTISLAGSLEAKLAASLEAGFSQIMISAKDLAGHPQGVPAAIAAVKASGLRVTGFQVLRDFEGLSGDLHAYKLDIAKAMLGMCHTLGAPLLLVCSSTSKHASDNKDDFARDLAKLAMLALPYNIKIAYEALSWGRSVFEYHESWEVVRRANMPNLGLCIDSFHVLATQTPLHHIDNIDIDKLFFVQLADYMWAEIHSVEERIATARTFRVFPGEGVHTAQLAELVRLIDNLGYRGDYSFEVFNDDYQQLPLDVVAKRAFAAATWLSEDVLQRALPLPNQLKLRA
jgi:sugar phosphate isomerase/epimerase